MQPYDFLMIAILAGLTLYGYSKGMAWQVAHLSSLIVSYFVALKFADQFAPMFGQTAPLNKFVAMLVIYIATSFGIWMLFRVVRGAIDSVKMEGFDHQMGALIGFARGVLWCVGITFFAVTLLPQSQKERIVATQSGHYIALLLDKTHAIVPPEVHDVIGPVIHRIEQGINPNGPGYHPGQPAPPAGPPQPQWPNQGRQPAPPQPARPHPNNGWPNPGNAGTWPNPNPSGPTNWPRPAPTGTPAQPAAWPNPNP